MYWHGHYHWQEPVHYRAYVDLVDAPTESGGLHVLEDIIDDSAAFFKALVHTRRREIQVAIIG